MNYACVVLLCPSAWWCVEWISGEMQGSGSDGGDGDGGSGSIYCCVVL